jgi:hypothetical protein
MDFAVSGVSRTQANEVKEPIPDRNCRYCGYQNRKVVSKYGRLPIKLFLTRLDFD